jgi:ATP/maltotriose-dependent transcriptional regulator MalT
MRQPPEQIKGAIRPKMWIAHAHLMEGIQRLEEVENELKQALKAMPEGDERDEFQALIFSFESAVEDIDNATNYLLPDSCR